MKRVLPLAGAGWVLLFALLPLATAQTVLTRVSEIRELPRETALKHLPVKLRGTILYVQPGWAQNCIIHDGGHGIFLSFSTSRAEGFLPTNGLSHAVLKTGLSLEVEGVTGPGWFAPNILPTHIKIIGTGSLPRPIEVTFPQLATGDFDCQLVTLTGVIQSTLKTVDAGNKWDQLQTVASTEEGGHFSAQGFFTMSSRDPNKPDPADQIDATARFTGCATGFWNRRGEQIGSRIQLLDRNSIEIICPPPKDPFDIPLTQISRLKAFAPKSTNQHRKRIIGQVTLTQSGEYFYLQADGRGIRVTTAQTNPLWVGDTVEVAGFVETPKNYAELHHAVFRRTGREALVPPIPLSWDKITTYQAYLPNASDETCDVDGCLVTIKCRLERIELQSANVVLLYLENQGHSFTATVPAEPSEDLVARFPSGSVLSVTGICVLKLMPQFSSRWLSVAYAQPVGFDLLLRSPNDIAVVRPASWWTRQRLLSALALVCLALVHFFVWILLLRRTVSKQAAQLLAEQQSKRDIEVSFKATLKERTRLAADLHDTVMQDLTAVTYQLEAARARNDRPETKPGRLNEFLYEIINRCRDDLQRSLWALRTGILEGRTFAEALQELANRTEQGARVNCHCHIESDGTPVAEFAASHLLLITQEAINNALKHARPETIIVEARIESCQIALTIEDDGSGFDLKLCPGPKDGHFGLMGMRERLAALNGSFSIQSAVSQGTIIQITIPLNPV